MNNETTPQAQPQAVLSSAELGPSIWWSKAENGNIRCWTSTESDALRLAREIGFNLEPLYSQAALDAAVAAERERHQALPCALTWAIQRLNSTPYAMTKDECVEMLRGLRTEIQALSRPNTGGERTTTAEKTNE